MKKTVLLVLIFISTLMLTSCGASAKVPTVNEKNRVELTQNEVKTELYKVKTTSKSVFKTLGNVEVKGKDKESVGFDFNAYFGDSKLMVESKFNIKTKDESSSGKASIYVNDSGMYLNLSTKGIDEAEAMNGKFKIDKNLFYLMLGSLDIPTVPGIDESIDLKDYLLNDDLLNLVGKYEGLSFYKKDNDFRIKLEVNKDLLDKASDEVKELVKKAFNDLEIEDIDNENIDFNAEMVIVIIDDMITEAGISISGESDGNKIKYVMSFSYIEEFPEFPKFDDYKDFTMPLI
ncbi:MAG: hypothetical protein RBQ97_00145 [Acholeplasma sp.]|nr:hypothetical protein [Acholeplasma sp.]